MSDNDEVLVLRLSNNQVQVTLTHAVWDNKNWQLVAAGIASTEKQSIQSIMASLATHGNRYLTLRTPMGYSDAYLQGAQMGFFHMGKSLSSANAMGYVECIEHPAAGDPRIADFDFFYVLARHDEDLDQKFIARLNTVIAWPVLPAWSDYLIQQGKDTHLIYELPCLGPAYKAAFIAFKQDSAWESIITAGLTGGKLSLN